MDNGERWNAARYLTNERYILIACYWLQEDGFQNNKDNHLIVLKNKEEYIKKFGRTAKNKKKVEEILLDCDNRTDFVRIASILTPFLHKFPSLNGINLKLTDNADIDYSKIGSRFWTYLYKAQFQGREILNPVVDFLLTNTQKFQRLCVLETQTFASLRHFQNMSHLVSLSGIRKLKLVITALSMVGLILALKNFSLPVYVEDLEINLRIVGKGTLISESLTSNTFENIETNEKFKYFFSSWKNLSKLRTLKLNVSGLKKVDPDSFYSGIVRNIQSLESLYIDHSCSTSILGGSDEDVVFHLKRTLESLRGARNSLKKLNLASSVFKVSGLPEDTSFCLQVFNISGSIILEDDIKILQRMVSDDPTSLFSIGPVLVENAEMSSSLLKAIRGPMLKKAWKSLSLEYRGQDSQEFLSTVKDNIKDFSRQSNKPQRIEILCKMIEFKEGELEEILDMLEEKLSISEFSILGRNKNLCFSEDGRKEINPF